MGGDINNRDYCTCEPRDEEIIFSETWEELYIKYDKRLSLLNPPFNPDSVSKDFCDYLFEKKTLIKFGKEYKCGFIGRINENIVIYLEENSTIIKDDNNKLLTIDSIDFIPGRLYYYFYPIPKTTESITVSVL